MAAADPTYGLDYSTHPRGDQSFVLIGGADMLAQEVARTVTTPEGALFWAPTATLDVGAWVNDNLSPADLDARARLIESKFDGDQRMTVSAALRLVERELLIDLTVVPATVDGVTLPAFVLTLDAATGQYETRRV